MMKKTAEIAVFQGNNGNTAKLNGEGKIVIYQYDQGYWKPCRDKDFSFKGDLGMVDFRRKMEEILVFLGQCRIVVGLNITGIPYYFLEKARVSIWEYDGRPQDFLDYVLSEEENQSVKSAKKSLQRVQHQGSFNAFVKPQDYSICIKGIEEKRTWLTSKQILMPYLRKGCFHTLEIVSHDIPDWLEKEALSRRLSLDVQRIDSDYVKITLKNKI